MASRLCGAALHHGQCCQPPVGIERVSQCTHCELHTLPGPCPGGVMGPRGTTDSKAKMTKQCTSSSNRNRNNLHGELFLGLMAADTMLLHSAVTRRGVVHHPEIQQWAPALQGLALGTGEWWPKALTSTSWSHLSINAHLCLQITSRFPPSSAHGASLPTVVTTISSPSNQNRLLHHIPARSILVASFSV